MYVGLHTCTKIQIFYKTNLVSVGAFCGGIGLPPAVMGWAASCDDGP